jgi:hypothetical protein
MLPRWLLAVVWWTLPVVRMAALLPAEQMIDTLPPIPRDDLSLPAGRRLARWTLRTFEEEAAAQPCKFLSGPKFSESHRSWLPANPKAGTFLMQSLLTYARLSAGQALGARSLNNGGLLNCGLVDKVTITFTRDPFEMVRRPPASCFLSPPPPRLPDTCARVRGNAGSLDSLACTPSQQVISGYQYHLHSKEPNMRDRSRRNMLLEG